MATSEQLRKNTNQHKPKKENQEEFKKRIKEAMESTKNYLTDKLKNAGQEGYYIKLENKISIKYIRENIILNKIRNNIENTYEDRTIKPVGGIIFLKSRTNKNFCKVLLLIAKHKQQGTNDKLEKEGKSKQARGNAIERIGKNLTGCRALFMHEGIILLGFYLQKGVILIAKILILILNYL